MQKQVRSFKITIIALHRILMQSRARNTAVSESLLKIRVRTSQSKRHLSSSPTTTTTTATKTVAHFLLGRHDVQRHTSFKVNDLRKRKLKGSSVWCSSGLSSITFGSKPVVRVNPVLVSHLPFSEPCFHHVDSRTVSSDVELGQQ